MQNPSRSISQPLRLPSICTLCQQYHSEKHAICSKCQAHFTRIGKACYHCALPIPEGRFALCGQCSKQKPSIDQAIAPYRFEEPLRALIHEFKYRDGLYLSSFLANLISKTITLDSKKTECLIPVPLHRKRLRQRGFNQAAELAKHLSRQLKLPYDLTGCKKIINTVPQATLEANQRQKNLRHAFQATPKYYQHVTLIDDIFTTGSTANEIAKTFKRQGVSRVDIWCCARVI